jgi:hypothetical protein
LRRARLLALHPLTATAKYGAGSIAGRQPQKWAWGSVSFRATYGSRPGRDSSCHGPGLVPRDGTILWHDTFVQAAPGKQQSHNSQRLRTNRDYLITR